MTNVHIPLAWEDCWEAAFHLPVHQEYLNFCNMKPQHPQPLQLCHSVLPEDTFFKKEEQSIFKSHLGEMLSQLNSRALLELEPGSAS